MKVSLICLILAAMGLSACGADIQLREKHELSNKQVEAKLPANCKLHNVGSYYPDLNNEFLYMPVIVIECTDAKVTTVNTTLPCGKTMCPKTSVQIQPAGEN